MSGRLVILPHKSWNVWNRDNQEKVLRDERLDRERNESERKERKRHLSEAMYSELSGSSSSQPSSSYKERCESRAEIDNHGKPLSNNNLMADWKFGDGSKELSKSLSWFEKKGATAIGDASSYSEQDKKRKRELDPLANFGRDTGIMEAKEDTLDSSNVQSSSSPSRADAVEISEKESLESSKHANLLSLGKYDSGEKKTNLQVLREKRLKREMLERKRELALLAHVDIYGKRVFTGYLTAIIITLFAIMVFRLEVTVYKLVCIMN